MQVLHAGRHKLVLLEFDPEVLMAIAKQAGFECRLEDSKRVMDMYLSAPERRLPLLLFDAADPSNLGWFSRCQFYVDGQTGRVLQTPLAVGNMTDRSGRLLADSVRLQISKELPETFRLPGKTPVTEQTVYGLLFNFLNALVQTGVGVCGKDVVKPIAGRTEMQPSAR